MLARISLKEAVRHVVLGPSDEMPNSYNTPEIRAFLMSVFCAEEEEVLSAIAKFTKVIEKEEQSALKREAAARSNASP